MNRPLTGLYWPGDTPRPSSKTHEKLIGIEASVHTDGDATSFAVHYTNQKPFRVHVELTEIAPILHEIRTAALSMMNLQTMKLDRGESKIWEIARNALRPAAMRALICPMTADRIFVLQFRDHAPLAIRQTLEEVAESKLILARAEAAMMH